MTQRPAFSPEFGKTPAVREELISFPWSPGFALTQKQKSIRAFHDAILSLHPYCKPLEISGRSPDALGASLSAFKLSIPDKRYPGRTVCVESVYQASKVFEGGIGPFPEAYNLDPHAVRERMRLYNGRKLISFRYGSTDWPLTPTRAFYDWIYCKILWANQNLVERLRSYSCFTDIEFNPKRSLNCQAYAVALYLSLEHAGVLEAALASKDAFLAAHPQETVRLMSAKPPHKPKKLHRDKAGATLKAKSGSELGLFPNFPSDF